MPSDSKGYDPQRSQVSDDTLTEWLETDLEEDLQQVPGVGTKAAEALRTAGVQTPYALIGQFLLLKESDMDSTAHCNAFWNWLNRVGVRSHRAGIVHCVAEKCNVFLPGIYDRSAVDVEMS